MKLRYVFAITVVILIVSATVGLRFKRSYRDFNDEEHALDRFAVALINDELLDRQIQNMENSIDSSNIILAVQCEDTFFYRFSSVTQKVRVISVFKGDGINEGDVLEVARAATNVITDADSLFNGLPLINMGFVNEMMPGKTYLIFLDRRINTYTDDMIYIQSDDFILAPIFCYDDITNIPQPINDDFNTYISYEKVKNNEFFISSAESNEKILFIKNLLLSKYSPD